MGSQAAPSSPVKRWENRAGGASLPLLHIALLEHP
jgi:hypothetical protein